MRSNRTGTVILRYAVPCDGPSMPASYFLYEVRLTRGHGGDPRLQVLGIEG